MSLTACTRDFCTGLAAIMAGRVVLRTPDALLHVNWLGWLAVSVSILSLWLIRRVSAVHEPVPPANESGVPMGVTAEG
jgi:hypothetical protein